jgi:hypothetical protein
LFYDPPADEPVRRRHDSVHRAGGGTSRLLDHARDIGQQDVVVGQR